MMARRSFTGTLPSTLLLLAGGSTQLASAQQPYNIDGRAGILDSARTLALDLMSSYTGNEPGGIPGLLPEPDYLWYEGGLLMGAMVDYWHYTGDETYNDVVAQGMLHQVGENGNFMPVNQTASMANDDQCYWALSAMLAAESGFEEPSNGPEWLTLAENVFDNLAVRFDIETGGACGGGLRWTIFPTTQGHDYKSTASNACFLNLGARLARFTGNGTYATYVEKAWDWLSDIDLIDELYWRVYDGAQSETNCTRPVKVTWSSNIGLLTHASAFMYNYTNGSEAWAQRVDGLSETILDEFFDNGALYELACEPRAGSCPSEVNFYKGLVHRWLAGTAQLAPFTADGILPKLATSAQAAIDQCTGGSSGRQCGFSWTGGRINPVEDDTSSSVGDQLSVLSAVFSLLVGEADAPIQSLRDRPSSGAGDDESDNETADETEESGGGSPEESATAPEGGSNGSLIEVSIVGVLAAFGSWILLSI